MANEKVMSKSAPASEQFDADELLAFARLDIERSNYEGALGKLKKVVATGSAPVDAYAMTARLYAQLGLFERAKDFFQKYLALNPNALVEKFQLGMAYFDTGHAKEAIALWSEILEKQPMHPPALFYKGFALAQQGQTAEAKDLLNALLKNAPADNLYFGRARELLQAIETGARMMPLNDGNGAGKSQQAVAKEAYKTEH